MKIFLRLLIISVIATVVWVFIFKSPASTDQSINIGIVLINTPKGVIHAQVADTDTTRQQGLSGVKNLADDTGMLFVFPSTGFYGFWMKDMNFALDIVWIDESKQVVSVEENALPSTYPSIFYPPVSIKYALELNSGIAAKFGLKKGINLDFDLSTP